jgi:hypothetical protein
MFCSMCLVVIQCDAIGFLYVLLMVSSVLVLALLNET